MRIGVPKEIKTQEFRVGMTPSGVATLVARGHQVTVEQNAGQGSAIPDEAYIKAGAKIAATKEQIWGENDMPVKEFNGLLEKVPADVPVVLVMVQCFSGGFADLIYKDADPNKGLSPRNRCEAELVRSRWCSLIWSM